MDHETLEKIIAALVGTYDDGSPLTFGMIPSMAQNTARRRILDAFSEPSVKNDDRKTTS